MQRPLRPEPAVAEMAMGVEMAVATAVAAVVGRVGRVVVGMVRGVMSGVVMVRVMAAGVMSRRRGWRWGGGGG